MLKHGSAAWFLLCALLIGCHELPMPPPPPNDLETQSELGEPDLPVADLDLDAAPDDAEADLSGDEGSEGEQDTELDLADNLDSPEVDGEVQETDGELTDSEADDAEPELPDPGAPPGSACTCDSDCASPDPVRHPAACVLGICFTLASAPCTEEGGPANCPAGFSCWLADGIQPALCWPRCTDFDCAGVCDEYNECSPTTSSSCDRNCGLYCPDPNCAPESNTTFCNRNGADCGELVALDNCDEARRVDCGDCDPGAGCGAGGTPNVCASSCVAWRDPLLATPNCGPAPLRVSFDGQLVLNTIGDAEIWSFYWTFGDGGWSEELNPVHTYTFPETFNPQAHVTFFVDGYRVDMTMEDFVLVTP